MNVVTAISLLSELLRQGMAISQLVQRAQQEGRDLTTAELEAVAAADSSARDMLVEAINRAKGQ